MKHDVSWTIASLLSILLATAHLAQDILLGFSPGGVANMGGEVALVLWLYATLVLGGRRSGYIIVLLFSLLASGIPVIHMTGAGLAGPRASGGGVLFVWTLLALGISSIFSVILSAQLLWTGRSGTPR